MRRGGSGYRPLVVGCVSAACVLSGCGLQERGTDVVNGKMLFSTKCGACHTLARAGTTGTVGPNLDDAFRQSRADGLKSSTFRGMVLRQIEDPNINTQVDPSSLKPLPSMPANVVKGQDARDVAAYVAQAAAAPGKDGGRLAEVGAKKAAGTAKEQNGTLAIPVASAGLAYQYADASATAGQVTITSKNPQPTVHDIALQGNGVDAKGARVQSGGTSKLTVNLKPGTYTFYCTVPGHRAGGMVGKLVVK